MDANLLCVWIGLALLIPASFVGWTLDRLDESNSDVPFYICTAVALLGVILIIVGGLWSLWVLFERMSS